MVFSHRRDTTHSPSPRRTAASRLRFRTTNESNFLQPRHVLVRAIPGPRHPASTLVERRSRCKPFLRVRRKVERWDHFRRLSWPKLPLLPARLAISRNENLCPAAEISKAG